MRINLYSGELRITVGVLQLIIYRSWPYRIRRERYNHGTLQNAAGAFSQYRTPSEQAEARRSYKALQGYLDREHPKAVVADGHAPEHHPAIREGGE